MAGPTAVILAAGLGSRLAGDSQATSGSKPLRKVAGVPLIVRTIHTLAAGGVQRAVVVTGYLAELLESTLREAELDVELAFAFNPRFRDQNGVSVLAAREHVHGDEFFLTMSDHVFEPEILRCLQEAKLPERGALLAVDHKLGDVFDMDDATKVRTDGAGSIVAIGKQLTDFDAVDTGVFRCSTALFEELARVDAERGDCSLSDGIGELARTGRMRLVDVGAAWWQDVDTPETLEEAERRLAR